jgi:hypothetical protein
VPGDGVDATLMGRGAMRSWAAGRVSEVMSPSCGRNRSPPDRFTSSAVGVRPDRLTAVLLLLQQREQVPAAEVAREPEVYRGRQRATTSTRQAQGATGRSHRLDHRHLRHRLAAHRRPHRGTARPHLEQTSTSMANRRRRPGPAAHTGMAVGPGQRRDQDPVLAANPRPTASCDRRAPRATRPPDRRSPTRRGRMGRPRCRVRVGERRRPRLCQRPTRPPQRRRPGPDAWTPRQLRHSFASLLPDGGVPIEQIARLIGHVGGSKVTDAVYRKQLRPVIDEGATAMNRVFPVVRGRSYSASCSRQPQTTKRPGPELPRSP